MADETKRGRARTANRGPAVVAMIALAWLAACNSGGATSSPSPAATVSGSEAPPPPAACASIDLRTPNGDAVLLTGRWRSPDAGTYYVRQAGSCVWIVGLSEDTGPPGGTGSSGWTNAFLGTLKSDFTLHGEWADVPWGRATGVGEVSYRMDFADVDGQEGISLWVTDASGGFGTGFLAQPVGRADLHVRLQESTTNCLTVVGDDGAIYELVVVTPGWSRAEPSFLSGPNGELVRTSEAFDVMGETAVGTGDCGPGTLLFADDIVVPS
jgi:hypothetical protein